MKCFLIYRQKNLKVQLKLWLLDKMMCQGLNSLPCLKSPIKKKDKMKTNTWNGGFQIVENCGNQAAKDSDLWKSENKQGDPSNCVIYSLEGIQAPTQGGDWVEKGFGAETVERQRHQYFTVHTTREKHHIERIPQISEGPPPVCSRVLITARVWGNYLEARKKPPERIEKNAWHSQLE